MIVGGGVFHPLTNAVEMLKFFRNFIATTPDELTVYAGIMTHPVAGPLAAMAAARGSTGGRVKGDQASRNSDRPFRTCSAPFPISCSRRSSTKDVAGEAALLEGRLPQLARR